MIKHMESCFPFEGCGFILKTGEFVPVENQSKEKDKFEISIADYLKHSRNIAKIVHSHISDEPEGTPVPDTDIVVQKASGVPWVIVVISTDGKYVRQFEFGEAVI